MTTTVPTFVTVALDLIVVIMLDNVLSSFCSRSATILPSTLEEESSSVIPSSVIPSSTINVATSGRELALLLSPVVMDAIFSAILRSLAIALSTLFLALTANFSAFNRSRVSNFSDRSAAASAVRLALAAAFTSFALLLIITAAADEVVATDDAMELSISGYTNGISPSFLGVNRPPYSIIKT